MFDFTQILLLAVIVILTFLLLVLGVQTFFVLKDLRKTLGRANKILDDVKSGTNVAKILGTLAALFMGKNLGKGVVDIISQKEKTQKIEGAKPIKSIRRFFKRSKV